MSKDAKHIASVAQKPWEETRQIFQQLRDEWGYDRFWAAFHEFTKETLDAPFSI